MEGIKPPGLSLLSAVKLPVEYFTQLCETHGLPQDVVLGMIARESGFPLALRFEKHYRWTYKVEHFARLNRWSRDTEEALQKFSYGPLQIMGAVARERGFQGDLTELRSSVVGLLWATKHLVHLRATYSSWPDIVSSYNQGSPRKKMLSQKYRNQDYVDYVYRRAKEFYE